MIVSLMLPVASGAEASVTIENEQFKEQQFNEELMELKAAVAEQIKTSERLPKLHEDLQDKSGDEMVPVIIHLSEKPVALEQGIEKLKGNVLSSSKIDEIRDRINKQHGRVDREMALKGITFDKGYSYDTVLNGFAAEVKADDLQKLLDIPDITLVEPDE